MNRTRPEPTPQAETDFPLGLSGYDYSDLHRPEALARLHQAFLDTLGRDDAELASAFAAYRAAPDALHATAVSDLLIDVARHVARFVARLFGVETALAPLAADAQAQKVLFRFKKDFVKWRCAKRKDPPLPDEALAAAEAKLGGYGLDLRDERLFAEKIMGMVDREAELRTSGQETAERERIVQVLDQVDAYLAERLRRHDSRGWVSLEQPHPIDLSDLVQIRRPEPALPTLLDGPAETRRPRDGFRLTDPRMSPREVASQVDYCIYCHDREKDSCAHGLRDKSGAIKKNSLGISLAGCPLDERISEAHLLEREGNALGALAMICIDNPMLPGTGHRICNDCMKSCIYQKQEPVNIPQIETRILTDCLDLPYGFEMYSLLGRWNPLNIQRPYTLPYNGKNVLVVGLGPAGYTLAHHLLSEGFGVVGVDGLKIEPLPEELVGSAAQPPRPVRDVRELEVELDDRILVGFGGVSEYGITVRWDKNFLTILYLSLARRLSFRAYGGVRFGGTLELDEVWNLGFSHVAIAAGAGRPTVIDIKNNLVRGIRKASDFLMGLQLTGAFKRSTLANLQVRLPALVIGGGLTAIDTATELLAYYVVQVEKTLERFEGLSAGRGEEAVWALYDEEEKSILRELIEHGRAVRALREQAKKRGEAPNFQPLLDAWGGVSIVYRKTMQDSPAYRLNHEEVIKCLEEGVRFVEQMSPKEAIADSYGALRALVVEDSEGKTVELPARTVCVAAGTSPNVIYEKEHPATFALDKKRQFFQAHRLEQGRLVPTEDGTGFFTSYAKEGKYVSFFGDNHPIYAGSVVKAMASAKYGYPQITALLNQQVGVSHPEAKPERAAEDWSLLVAKLDDELMPRVTEVRRLTPTIVEVVVRAPAAARKFQPGMFYRLQNYETYAPRLNGTRLGMEGLALTGAWVDKQKGLLSLIVLEMGSSSRLCAMLKPGEPVVVMGPTGSPTELPERETVLLCGGGLGNAVLFSIARGLRQKGTRVIYFAGYKKAGDVFKQDEIEAGTDQIVWSVDSGDLIMPRRAQDAAFRGNIVEAMVGYAQGKIGKALIPLSEVDRVIAIGSDRMMAAVAKSRHTVLAPYLRPNHVGIGSINSPMQCMMKEICAQCLQKHVDPATGKETFVFSCFNQDQKLDEVDWPNLNARLRQNTVAEKLSNLWLDHLLSNQNIPRV